MSRGWNRQRRIAVAAATLTLSMTLPAQEAARPADPGRWIRAARVVVAPDTVLEPGGFLVRDGKVAQVGGNAPAGVEVVDTGAATVVPGFVDPHATLGLDADLAETIDAMTPQLRAADAFDPFAKALPRAARAGVTTLGLSPTSQNALGGLAAAVKTGATGTLLADACYLKAALVREALDQDRQPTSRMGAIDLLRAAFREAAEPATPAARVLREVRDGGRNLVLHARTRGEIGSALRLCEEFQLQPILLGGDEAEHFLPRLRARRASVMLAPLSFTSKREALELPAKLERAGIPFSFSAPAPETLRVAAALAVRNGASRGAALAALTRVPAQQLGVADRVGALRQGMEADFLVFDGDPTELRSRLRAVWIAGRPLPAAEENE